MSDTAYKPDTVADLIAWLGKLNPETPVRIDTPCDALQPPIFRLGEMYSFTDPVSGHLSWFPDTDGATDPKPQPCVTVA